ncbi:MAG: prolyl oligopeptidase family serine peptidase [Caldilineaceae bacterium]
MGKMIAPYGAWRSPVSADLLVKAGVSLGYLHVATDTVYWVEGRPLEKGRYVIVKRTPDGKISDVTPAGYNARTLVHEYGGGAYIVHGATVYFANFTDQRLYRQTPTSAPQPITPEPPTPRSLRYADLRITPDGRWLVCVRESHQTDGNVVNELVALPTDGSCEPHVLTTGYDFYSAPRISPDGRQLAWLCWQNPLMPWDGTELWVAPLDAEAKLGPARHVAGSVTESLFQPEWSPDGVLHFISDRTDWWNLYREVNGKIEAVALYPAELGEAYWVFDLSRYVFLADQSIVCIYSEDGIDRLGRIAPNRQQIEPIACEYTALHWVRTAGATLWLIGGSPTSGSTIFSLDPTQHTITPIKQGMQVDVDLAFFSIPQPIEFPTENQQTAHALYYPPTNPHYQGPANERPPLIVICHGGPTSATNAQLSLSVQFWTSRGIGVVDVDYGGSTGYGRAYRERLKGNWGIVDVLDCINAARYLIAQDKVDGQRVAIRGGSAGGYTTLRALTWQNFFAAGASHFGLAELEAFVHDTHKFEARYLDGLIGPYPAQKALYYDRSPVNFADQLNTPVILFQGLEDKIVPPNQAETMVAALQAKKLPHAYLAFAGEQHGFRKAENIIRTSEAELYFYGKVFDFDPADEIEPVEIENLR